MIFTKHCENILMNQSLSKVLFMYLHNIVNHNNNTGSPGSLKKHGTRGSEIKLKVQKSKTKGIGYLTQTLKI